MYTIDKIENGISLTKHHPNYYKQVYYESLATAEEGKQETSSRNTTRRIMDPNATKSPQIDMELQLDRTNTMKKDPFKANDVKCLFHLNEHDSILLNIDHIKEINVRNSYLLPSDFVDLKKSDGDDSPSALYEYLLKSCLAEDALLALDKQQKRKRLKWCGGYRKLWDYLKQLMQRILLKCCK